MSEDMVASGYKEIVNIDISSVAVDLMSKRCKDIPGLSFKTMNVLKMDFEDASFDSVIDKGTLDAILCGDGSVQNAEKMFTEISRILKPGGVFLDITYGSPESRLNHLERSQFKWSVSSATVGKSTSAKAPSTDDVHYIYVMTKK